MRRIDIGVASAAVVVLLVVSFGLGVICGQVTFEPQVVTEYTTEYVTDLVVKYEIKEVPVQLRSFKGIEEMEEFLDERDTTIRFTFGGGEMIDLLDYDCDDFARALRDDAHAKGFHMNFQIVENHALNSTIIGNEIYFIEPSTHEYWVAAVVD